MLPLTRACTCDPRYETSRLPYMLLYTETVRTNRYKRGKVSFSVLTVVVRQSYILFIIKKVQGP